MAEQGGGKRILVKIPSAEEVERQSAVRAQPLNLFRPSSSTGVSASAPAAASSSGNSAAGASEAQGTSSGAGGQGQGGSSFTEAFSFLRNTEFYSPPPPRPPRSPRPNPLPSSATASSSGGVGVGGGGGGEGEAAAAAARPSSLPGRPYAAVAKTGNAQNSILVSNRQKGNSVLKYIRNARWMFSDIVPDYILGQNTCALYLSLRYHLLHPEYLYYRIRELQKAYRLRVVLCYVDVDDVIKSLHEVTKTCLLHDCSLLCAWSHEECARYLETIKIYENKPADGIQERPDRDYLSRLTSSLTTIRHINKTDVLTLGSRFKTVSAIFNASMEDLARCPGIGETKLKRLYDCFNEPFKRTPAAKAQEPSSGEKSAAGLNEGRKQPKEGEDLAAGNAGEETVDKDSEEVRPASKLINRADEASVRTALDALKGKRKEAASKPAVQSVSMSTGEGSERASKMINRASEASVRAALKGKRKRAAARPAVQSVSTTTGKGSEEPQPSNKSQNQKTDTPLPESFQDEYVISLSD